MYVLAWCEVYYKMYVLAWTLCRRFHCFIIDDTSKYYQYQKLGAKCDGCVVSLHKGTIKANTILVN